MSYARNVRRRAAKNAANPSAFRELQRELWKHQGENKQLQKIIANQFQEIQILRGTVEALLEEKNHVSEDD